MRSAEEYRKQFNLSDESSDELDLRCDDIESAINEARKDTIEECAERAKSEWIRYGTQMGHAVDKQSILSLIQELK